jgi:hypothetical protein
MDVSYFRDLLFTGLDFGTNNSLAGNPNMTIIITYVKTTPTKGHAFGWGNIAVNQAWALYDDNSFTGMNGFTSTSTFCPTVILTTGVWNVFRFNKPTGAPSTSSSFRNGINVASGIPGVGTINIRGTDGLIVGHAASPAGSTFTFGGDIGQLMIANSNWSESLCRRLEQASATAYKIGYG